MRDFGCNVHGGRRDSITRSSPSPTGRRDSLAPQPLPPLLLTSAPYTNGHAMANGAPVPPPRKSLSQKLSAASSQRQPNHNHVETSSAAQSPFVAAKRTAFPSSQQQPPVTRSASAYTLNRAAQLRMHARESVERSAPAATVQRRQSFAAADSRANVKRNSWTPAAGSTLHHPSAFPSMLRGFINNPPPATQSQSAWDVRGIGTSTLPRRTPSDGVRVGVPSLSTTNLRRRESLNVGRRPTSAFVPVATASPTRRDSFGGSSFINNNLNTSGPAPASSGGHQVRRDSFGSTHSRGDSADLKQGDLRRQSFGGSLYLRPDSTGNAGLVRRDSFGSQNLRREPLNNGTSAGSSVFLRADSAGNANLVRRDRRDHHGGSQTLRRDSLNNSSRSIYVQQSPKRESSLGPAAPVAHHMRRDSFGSQHVLLARRDSTASRASVPRDYVSERAQPQTCAIRGHNQINSIFGKASDSVDSPATAPKASRKPSNSILRKDSFKSSKKHVSYEDDNHSDVDTVDASAAKDAELLVEVTHQLTAANLSKHSTILEENLLNERQKSLVKKLSFEETTANGGQPMNMRSLVVPRRDRRDSAGSVGSTSAYLAARRISMDSLDTRRNSWAGRRGSQASSTEIESDKEVRWRVGAIAVKVSECVFAINRCEIVIEFSYREAQTRGLNWCMLYENVC